MELGVIRVINDIECNDIIVEIKSTTSGRVYYAIEMQMCQV